MSIIIRGLGGFGYKGNGITKELAKIPNRNADKVLKTSSYLNQAFVYRLTGDFNPLHVDPNISSMQNYDRPILHGISFTIFRIGQLWKYSQSYSPRIIGKSIRKN